MTSTKILLFDVDGVLVDPIAYRQGIIAVLKELLPTLSNGLQPPLPDEADIATFEASGVHDVWDITNIIFALWIVRATQSQSVAKEDYQKLAITLASISDGIHPPLAALEMFCEEIASASINAHTKDECLVKLKSFLLETRSAYGSVGTRLFQNIILGSSEFEKTYGLKSEFSGPSLMTSVDRALINRDSVAKLKNLQKSAVYKVGVYTARPSHPPSDCDTSLKGYSPEAELALSICGMADFPLVAMGMMDWLADRKGDRSENLTKPNVTQACAALLASVAGQSKCDVIEEAYNLDKLGKHPDNTALFRVKENNIQVYVFEDTISGIKPMIELGERLRHFNYKISIIPLGITSDSNKKASLTQLCDQVFPDVNEALETVI